MILKKLIGVLFMWSCVESYFTPPEPIALPVEGGGYEVITPPTPIVLDLCNMVLCELKCQNGFQKDENDCPLCQCSNPCDALSCSEMEKCFEGKNSEGLTKAFCELYEDEKKKLSVTCEDVFMCRMKCDHGLKKDIKGCSVCQCHDPCEDVACPYAKDCQVHEYKSSENQSFFSGECTKHRCMPSTCSLTCTYGHPSDEFGCQTCFCYDPCDDVKCGDGLTCTRSHSKTAGKYEAICKDKKEEEGSDTCKDVSNCRMICDHGLKKDIKGCSLCQCHDPCEILNCGDGMECLPEKVEGKFQGVCKPISKCFEVNCPMICQWGFARDSFNCPLCACADPCHDGACKMNEKCTRSYDLDTSRYEAKCQEDQSSVEALCASEDCSMWCRYKSNFNTTLHSKCHTCNCQDRCKDLECKKGEECRVSTFDQCKGDMCFMYDHPHCHATVKCPTLKCLIPCLNGYKKDSRNCSTCDCQSSRCLGGCKDRQFCAMLPMYEPFGPRFTCLDCPNTKCLRGCPFGYMNTDHTCPTCICKPNPCFKARCAYGLRCQPTFSHKYSDYICIKPTQKACSSVVKYLQESARPKLKNFIKWSKEYLYYDSSTEIQCDEQGDFKEVQIMNGSIVCMIRNGAEVVQNDDCYTKGLVRSTVTSPKIILNVNESFKKRLTENLCNKFKLGGRQVVVSKLSEKNGKIVGDILLLGKKMGDQRKCLNIIKYNWEYKYHFTRFLEHPSMKDWTTNSQIYPDRTRHHHHKTTTSVFLASYIDIGGHWYLWLIIPALVFLVGVISVVLIKFQMMTKGRSPSKTAIFPPCPPPYPVNDSVFSSNLHQQEKIKGFGISGDVTIC